MSYALERLIDRLAPRELARETPASHAVVIRPARDAETEALHDLAELDSTAPLRGRALVAVVDGEIWAARGLDDGRAIADPFRPSAEAAGLLALRVKQLHAAGAPTVPRATRLRRRLAGRAGAS